MSSYLTFRKNGVTLGSYSRSTKVYQALNNYAKYGDWGPLSTRDLVSGIEDLREEIRDYEKAIENQKIMMGYLKTYEDIHEAQNTVSSYQESIEECKAAIVTIQTYLDIYDKYNTEDQPKDGEKWEWMTD